MELYLVIITLCEQLLNLYNVRFSFKRNCSIKVKADVKLSLCF